MTETELFSAKDFLGLRLNHRLAWSTKNFSHWHFHWDRFGHWQLFTCDSFCQQFTSITV